MSLRMDRQFSRFALFCFMLYSLSNLFAQFAGGTGSQEDPYLVETAAHLYNVHYHLDACYRQIADIDLGVAPYNQGEGWWPIGDSMNLPSMFTGRYNGSGHSISNLYIQTTSSVQGLFGVTNNAYIDSMNLINVDIYANCFTGGLVGYASSTTINGCHASGDIIAGLYTGGLAGQCDANSLITGCSSAGSVLGDTYVGGLVGNLISGTIIQSISSVNMINGLSSDAGGLIGKASDSFINECHTSGELWGQYAAYVGGLIGYAENTDVNNCYTLGDITGNQYVGGLCGVLLDSDAINCYTLGGVTGSLCVGGLIGFASESSIEKNYSRGNILGITPVYNIGGLIGTLRYSTLNNCYAWGNISGTIYDVYIGGLIGLSEQSSINNCYSIGAVHQCASFGGLIAVTNLNSVTMNSYWNIETSGCSISAGGEGRTTDDMTYPLASNTYVDWDFTNIWVADLETNYGYPYLNTSSPVNTVAEPTFSPVSGDYTEPISVTIHTQTADVLIYYTLNGTDPSPQSCLYTEPILIDTTTVIKARAYKDGWNPSVIAVSTYVYYVDNNDLSEIPLIQSCTSYPNPFNSNTTISFNLPKATHASLDIYNLKGQKICTLANDNFSKGEHSLKWNGRTDDGKSVPCGMYLYKLKGNGFEITRKMTLMK